MRIESLINEQLILQRKGKHKEAIIAHLTMNHTINLIQFKNIVYSKINKKIVLQHSISGEENEAYLEEIEKSIIENIESTRTIINRNSTLNYLYEDRPLALDSVIKIRSSMMETMRPKELNQDVKTIEPQPQISKSPKMKVQSNSKAKLNYHKLKQKSKAYSGSKNQDNFEITVSQSCEIKTPN